jgi:hypothetical protein
MGIEIMGSHGMRSARVHGEKQHSRGFTLIASLLMLLLLSGIAIGLLMMTNTEGKVGGTDLQNNMAFHAAEGGIEKMASDLASTFTNAQSPTATQICAVSGSSYQPVMTGVTWTQYSVTPASGCTTEPPTHFWGQIQGSGQEAGLWAQIIPVNMLVTAALPGGQEVSMTRGAQVALIPVFQYGVFCEGDCGFFDSPNLNFAGRVHTNGDLYLGVMQGFTLTFHDKMEAYGNVVTEVLPNGLTINAGSGQDVGNVYIPTAVGGCSTPTTNCVTKAANSDPASSPYGNGSVQGAGGNPAQSTYNGLPVTSGANNWNTFSNTTTNHMLINGNYGSTTAPGTGAKKLSLPFVAPGSLPNEIIRRPLSNDSTALQQSREYNMAQIHILLDDDPANLPGGASDTNNVRLANVSGSNPYGITMTAGNYPAALGTPPANNTYNLYFAAASNAVPNFAPGANCSGIVCVPDWPYAPAAQTLGTPLPSLQPAGAPIDWNHGTPTVSLCPPAGVNASSTPTPPATCPWTDVYPYYAPPNPVGATLYNSQYSTTWNLLDGYLRVEYIDASGTWHPVTNEWLSLGFARGIAPPTASEAGTPATGAKNPINPNAILLLQEPADRAGSLTLPTSTATAPTCTAWNTGHTVCTAWTAGVPPAVVSDLNVGVVGSTGGGEWYFGITPSTPTTQSLTQYNWYPINFYDAREGEPRDVIYNNNSCTTNGVMNAIELDVGNLKQWLLGNIGTSGTHVDYVQQNGYVLYFSDRRGMMYNPNSPLGSTTRTGDSGLEDVVNSSSAAGVPDGVLDPVPVGRSFSPEDGNLNGHLDAWGEANLGLGLWGTAGNAAKNLNAQITGAGLPYDPYGADSTNNRIGSCGTTGRKNWVSGARHALKLVDGSLGNIPLSPNGGGFTVAAEGPVYILGDYNSNPADTFFSGATSTGPGPDMAGHSPAAVIADTVTVLSNTPTAACGNGWLDQQSFLGSPGCSGGSNSPTQPINNRTAVNTYYRVAVAAGKVQAFPFPSWANSTPDYSYGTDGGIHNFLHFLEDWNSPGATLNYGGSLVSLYYSTYNTGIFKCCTYSVYLPPVRNYIFDSDFTLPSGLPPGTPMFKDIESLSYRQLLNTRTAGQ